ncbi:MAG: hypothetical protein NZ529_11605, partial [Cytophagaceae bacterium]|nr:hypothetical protein [Cytophagaceae bacterium]MDW8457430.1 transposase [Cytophagaceae bacterium]
QEVLNKQGTVLITKPRKNMRSKTLKAYERYYLSKRGMIESIFDILMTQCDIDHTRHRSPVNAIVHTLAGILAYSHFLRKPCVEKVFYSEIIREYLSLDAA